MKSAIVPGSTRSAWRENQKKINMTRKAVHTLIFGIFLSVAIGGLFGCKKSPLLLPPAPFLRFRS